MKIFISQPMMGKSDELIAAERKLIIERVKSMYGNDVEILDSLFNDYNTSDIKHLPVAFLGRSLEVLAQTDVALFSAVGNRREAAVSNMTWHGFTASE